jgi:hypothetical protein
MEYCNGFLLISGIVKTATRHMKVALQYMAYDGSGSDFKLCGNKSFSDINVFLM